MSKNIKIGDKIKGFKFEAMTNGIAFPPPMERYVGVEGEVEEILEDRFKIRFPDANYWFYPLPSSHVSGTDDGTIRVFPSGATRDTAEDKLDFEGFLCPRVLTAYAEYMHKNRAQSDGTLRDSDNWQKGIPQNAYMKSMFRHFMDVWKNHRGLETKEDEITNLCALLFNVSGMLHEKLKQ